MSLALRESLEASPVLPRGDYEYFVHALTDGTFPLHPQLLEEVADLLMPHMPKDATVILSPEAMGLPLATTLSRRTGLPLVVARKRSYGLPDEVAVAYETGYSTGHLYVNGVTRHDRVVIVDDVVSRAGTVRALAEAIKGKEARLMASLIAVNKSADLAALSTELGAPVVAAATIAVQNRQVRVVD